MRRRHAVLALLTAVVPVACGGEGRPLIADPCTRTPAPGVTLSGCHLRDQDLRGVDLSGAFLHDVDLGGADLTGADLTDAQLSRVWAVGTNLRDADLSGALVNGGDLQKALYCNTTMPEGTIANGSC